MTAVDCPTASTQGHRNTSASKGAISGTVTDNSQAVVSDAKAVPTNPAGDKVESLVSDKGIYSFSDITPGTYTLTVTAPNFAPQVVDNVTLTAGLDLTMDATLEPAKAKTEEVNVEASGVGQVETESSRGFRHDHAEGSGIHWAEWP